MFIISPSVTLLACSNFITGWLHSFASSFAASIITSRIKEKGLLQRNSSSAGSSRLGSDGRSLGRGSDSGAGSDKGSQLNPSDRIATMYDSLAAELRQEIS